MSAQLVTDLRSSFGARVTGTSTATVSNSKPFSDLTATSSEFAPVHEILVTADEGTLATTSLPSDYEGKVTNDGKTLMVTATGEVSSALSDVLGSITATGNSGGTERTVVNLASRLKTREVNVYPSSVSGTFYKTISMDEREDGNLAMAALDTDNDVYYQVISTSDGTLLSSTNLSSIIHEIESNTDLTPLGFSETQGVILKGDYGVLIYADDDDMHVCILDASDLDNVSLSILVTWASDLKRNQVAANTDGSTLVVGHSEYVDAGTGSIPTVHWYDFPSGTSQGASDVFANHSRPTYGLTVIHRPTSVSDNTAQTWAVISASSLGDSCLYIGTRGNMTVYNYETLIYPSHISSDMDFIYAGFLTFRGGNTPWDNPNPAADFNEIPTADYNAPTLIAAYDEALVAGELEAGSTLSIINIYHMTETEYLYIIRVDEYAQNLGVDLNISQYHIIKRDAGAANWNTFSYVRQIGSGRFSDVSLVRGSAPPPPEGEITMTSRFGTADANIYIYCQENPAELDQYNRVSLITYVNPDFPSTFNRQVTLEAEEEAAAEDETAAEVEEEVVEVEVTEPKSTVFTWWVILLIVLGILSVAGGIALTVILVKRARR